jgi:TonB family protein
MTTERLSNWADAVANRLLSRAAWRAPAALSARLEEEWRADMAERHGQWSRLRFALGCCWATSVIAREYGGALLPATGAGHAPVVDYAANSPLFSPRTSTFLLVAGLHAAVLFALITMHSKFQTTTQQNIVIRPVDRQQLRPELPPLPRPQISSPKILVPVPEAMPAVEPEAQDAAQATLREPPSGQPTSATPARVNRVQGGPGSGFPGADDFYPSVAIHMGEQGVATVRACVDAKGRLTAEPSIVESTGSRRLDEGALKLARAGSGHYRASSDDGRPVDSCYPFRIRFSLK